MATPTLAQARSHYDTQRRIAASAVLAVRRLLRLRRPLPEVVSTVAAYQFASAATSVGAVAAMADARQPLAIPQAFMGISSHGFPIAEPIVATIDRHIAAPVAPLPDVWWRPEDVATFLADIEQLVASEVADAGRTASQTEFVARPDWQNYVRMLNPPSCPRCAILAGRIYRDLDAFQRHPGCDCVMVPVRDWESAHDAGLVVSARDAFEQGQIRGLSKADEQAIRDGADISQVVNAAQGTATADVFGRRAKTTTSSTTKRAAWRRANPTRLVRLRPEAIYQIVDAEYGGDHEQAVRLLRIYGYIT